MYNRITKLLCLVLIAAILAGVFTGCSVQSADTRNTSTGFVETTAPSTAATSPTIPEPEPEPSLPPKPEPLPPSAAPTLQLSTSKKPAQPDIAIPKLSAANYFIFDTRLDDFLYSSCKTDKALYPASTTKLFTTYVALQYLDPAQIVTVGGELSYVASDTSTAGFKKGDRVSVEDLAYGALLPSGCDASYILAAAAGKVILGNENATAKQAINAFMKECNRLGKELGMTKTNFVTPDGYHDPDHKISVQAFVIIGKCSLENPVIRKIVSTSSATITYTNSNGKTCTKTYTNTNYCIRPDSKYYSSLCIGLKTGFTDQAGYCLLTAFEVDGRYILIGIFGCSNSTDRFKDTSKLFDAYLPYL